MCFIHYNILDIKTELKLAAKKVELVPFKYRFGWKVPGQTDL